MAANLYFWIILGSLLGFYLLDTAANRLNLKSLKATLPDEFKGIYDEAEYRRLLEYTGATSRFEFIDSTFNLAVLLLFWFLGGYRFLNHLAESLFAGPISRGLLFMGALWLGHLLINLPFEIYETFVIEQKFGFNKTTPRTFFADQIRSLLLGAILGGGLLSLVLALFQHGGAHIWLWAWIAISALLLLFVYIAPAVILPLFNKFTPLDDGDLKTAILDYGKAQDFPISGLFVMDGSRRSTKSNAFFTGLGRMKKIVLFDTLIKQHTVGELVAVLAHEIGHYKRHHIPQHLAAAVANIGVFLFLASNFIHSRALFEAFGVETMPVYCGLAFFLVFYNPLSRLLSVVRGFQTRRHEFEADRFATETTGQPKAMIDALKKLSKSNLANLAPHPLCVVLYHSHPPVLQRIRAIQALVRGQF
jgi:STE24 endopeptidase